MCDASITCTRCKKTYPSTREHFHRSPSSGNPENLRKQCKACEAKRRRNHHLKSLYGLCADKYQELRKRQGGRCPVCTGLLRPPKCFGQGKRHAGNVGHVDHCHKTGKVRGILCSNCNRALGLLGDSVLCLSRAIEYLQGIVYSEEAGNDN